MQSTHHPEPESSANPLQKLNINAPWEYELKWSELWPSPWHELPFPPDPQLPTGSSEYVWAAGHPYFPVQLDLGSSYPLWESKLLFTLFCHYHHESRGYALSSWEQWAWIYFEYR